MDPRGQIRFRSDNYVTFPSHYSYTLVMGNGILVDENSGASAEVYLGDEEQDYDFYIEVTEPGPDHWSIQAQYYAAEYCCKFNRRKLGNSAYLRILAALAQ